MRRRKKRRFVDKFDLFLLMLLLAFAGLEYLGSASIDLNDYSALEAEANTAVDDIEAKVRGIWQTTETTSAQGDTLPTAYTLQEIITIAQDTFTDADRTRLLDHIPDIGTGWSVSHVKIDIVSNIAGWKDKKGVTQVARETTNIGDDDMNVTANLNHVTSGCIGATQFAGIVARVDPANFDNYYLVANEDQCPAEIHLYKVVGGTKTELGTGFALPLNDNNNPSVKLEIRNDSQKVFVDGILRITANEPDTTLQGNNFAGIAFSDDDRLRPQVDNFLSETSPNRQDLSNNPHTATTSGNYIYEVEVRAKSSSPPNTTYKASLWIDGNLIGTLYVKTDSDPAGSEVLYLQFDIGSSVPQDALYFLDVDLA